MTKVCTAARPPGEQVPAGHRGRLWRMITNVTQNGALTCRLPPGQ
jgi:hypothetical protein